MRLQRNNYRHENTQGAATLYPGLCASALTARTDYGIVSYLLLSPLNSTYPLSPLISSYLLLFSLIFLYQ